MTQDNPALIALAIAEQRTPLEQAAPQMLKALLLARGYIMGSFSDSPLEEIEAAIAAAEQSPTIHPK